MASRCHHLPKNSGELPTKCYAQSVALMGGLHMLHKYDVAERFLLATASLTLFLVFAVFFGA